MLFFRGRPVWVIRQPAVEYGDRRVSYRELLDRCWPRRLYQMLETRRCSSGSEAGATECFDLCQACRSPEGCARPSRHP